MRSKVWQRVALAVVVVAGVVFFGAWQAGAVAPRLGPPWHREWSADAGTFRYTFTVSNYGYVPVTVTGAGRNTPGLQLTRVDGTFPTTLHKGDSITVTLFYRVTDCDAVTKDNWPATLRVERPWGTSTAYVELPPQLPEDWQRDPTLPSPMPTPRYGPTEWQRMQADVSCARTG